MGSVTTTGDFTAPPVEVSFDGLLFDMDGTIIDSTDAVEKHWHTYVAVLSATLQTPPDIAVPESAMR